ncbi:MAG: AI-2E family transporter [Cyclobacteriaceae bacterium]
MDNKERFNRITVLIATIAVSAVFIAMIRGFLLAILLAAIFSGLLYPLYTKILNKFNQKSSAASIVTILIFVFVIIIPFGTLLAVVVDQAIDASETVGPMLKEKFGDRSTLLDDLNSIPIVQKFFPDHDKFVNTVEGLVAGIGKFVINNLGQISSGAVNFLFEFFVMLFTMFYFLIDGKNYLAWMLYMLPLQSEEENLLLSKFTTVTRATLKGTFVIGAVQGAMGGVAMWIAGIPNTLFWGVIMAVFSIIPAVGPAVVWLPAGLYLLATGNAVAGIGLILFGAIVIGNIDNLIRPKLVGKEAELPDLMIFFGTLGGLALFGASGIIIGPIIAALFLTLWEIYGTTFSDSLDPSSLMIKGEMVIDHMVPKGVRNMEQEMDELEDLENQSGEDSAEKKT